MIESKSWLHRVDATTWTKEHKRCALIPCKRGVRRARWFVGEGWREERDAQNRPNRGIEENKKSSHRNESSRSGAPFPRGHIGRLALLLEVGRYVVVGRCILGSGGVETKLGAHVPLADEQLILRRKTVRFGPDRPGASWLSEARADGVLRGADICV